MEEDINIIEDEETLLDKARDYYDENVEVSHNLYNILGMTLLEGIRDRRLDPDKLRDTLKDLPGLATANIGIDLGKGYGLDLGYNQYIGDRRQDLKLNISKKF